MEIIQLHDKVFKPFISNAEIESSIDQVADKIRVYYQERKTVPIFLCVLNGAIMFTAALMKRLNFPAELISIKMSSYCGTETTGEVKIPLGLTGSVEGRDVLIIEDIVDSGYTMVALKKLLFEKGASDVRICSMLLKPESLKVPLQVDFVAKEIPSAFIVGYGLDYNELGRNLDEIYVIDNQ